MINVTISALLRQIDSVFLQGADENSGIELLGADAFAHGSVLLDESGIFDGHVVPCKRGHLGTQGNVIQRYKAMKDLLFENKVYDIELDFDVAAINDIIVKFRQ